MPMIGNTPMVVTGAYLFRDQLDPNERTSWTPKSPAFTAGAIGRSYRQNIPQ